MDITTLRAPSSSAQSRDHAFAPYTFIRLRCCRGALAINFACSPGGAGRDPVHYLVLARLARSVLSEPPLSPQCFQALAEAVKPPKNSLTAPGATPDTRPHQVSAIGHRRWKRPAAQLGLGRAISKCKQRGGGPARAGSRQSGSATGGHKQSVCHISLPKQAQSAHLQSKALPQPPAPLRQRRSQLAMPGATPDHTRSAPLEVETSCCANGP